MEDNITTHDEAVNETDALTPVVPALIVAAGITAYFIKKRALRKIIP